MKQFLLSLCLGLGFIPAAYAQQTVSSELVALESGDAVRGWEAVGRLDVRNKGFCTAALIENDLLLTAAHCVYDERGELIDKGRLTFSAGLRSGRAEATRGIAQVVAHPEYNPSGGNTRNSKVAMDMVKKYRLGHHLNDRFRNFLRILQTCDLQNPVANSKSFPLVSAMTLAPNSPDLNGDQAEIVKTV